jgi:hypothetical protein
LVFKDKRGIQRRKFDLSGIGGKGGRPLGVREKGLKKGSENTSPFLLEK